MTCSWVTDCDQVVNKSWTSHVKIVNKLWTSHGQIIELMIYESCQEETSHEQVMNMSCKNGEQVMIKS